MMRNDIYMVHDLFSRSHRDVTVLASTTVGHWATLVEELNSLVDTFPHKADRKGSPTFLKQAFAPMWNGAD